MAAGRLLAAVADAASASAARAAGIMPHNAMGGGTTHAATHAAGDGTHVLFDPHALADGGQHPAEQQMHGASGAHLGDAAEHALHGGTRSSSMGIVWLLVLLHVGLLGYWAWFWWRQRGKQPAAAKKKESAPSAVHASYDLLQLPKSPLSSMSPLALPQLSTLQVPQMLAQLQLSSLQPHKANLF